MLEKVFDHLRTLQRILHDYTSRLISENAPHPGVVRYEWQRGALMFTDLAGFTRLMEANASQGRAGAAALLKTLNAYFAEMIETISKSGGDLMEFTGDALFAFFPESDRVQQAKLTESNGLNERVNLSKNAFEQVKTSFRFEEGKTDFALVVDDLTDEQLGEYEIMPRRRQASNVLFERGMAGLLHEIEEMLKSIEPLASFIPAPVLNLLVESAAERHIPPDFPEPTVMFVNFVGLPEMVDRALPGEELKVVNSFSRAFAMINAAVEARGGVLKKITYHLSGSDIVIYFGVPTAHTNDPARAAESALAIREIVRNIKPPTVGGIQPEISCQIGINQGAAFVAEVGEPRGRREFNVLGDTVNTTARLMNLAERDQIIVSAKIEEGIRSQFVLNKAGTVTLKGRSGTMDVFELAGSNT